MRPPVSCVAGVSGQKQSDSLGSGGAKLSSQRIICLEFQHLNELNTDFSEGVSPSEPKDQTPGQNQSLKGGGPRVPGVKAAATGSQHLALCHRSQHSCEGNRLRWATLIRLPVLRLLDRAGAAMSAHRVACRKGTNM